MSKVDPLQKLIPSVLTEDPEVEGFIRNLLDVVDDLRERTGGASDLVESGNINALSFPPQTVGIDQLDGFYVGNGAPDSATGVNGDFYFRRDGTTDTIYNKQAGSWAVVA